MYGYSTAQQKLIIGMTATTSMHAWLAWHERRNFFFGREWKMKKKVLVTGIHNVHTDELVNHICLQALTLGTEGLWAESHMKSVLENCFLDYCFSWLKIQFISFLFFIRTYVTILPDRLCYQRCVRKKVGWVCTKSIVNVSTVCVVNHDLSLWVICSARFAPRFPSSMMTDSSPRISAFSLNNGGGCYESKYIRSSSSNSDSYEWASPITIAALFPPDEIKVFFFVSHPRLFPFVVMRRHLLNAWEVGRLIGLCVPGNGN